MSRSTGESDSLSRYLAGARDRSPEIRAKAVLKLRQYVEKEAKEVSSEAFSQTMAHLFNRIFDLMSSSHDHEKLGGLAIIDELIDVPYEENETKFLKCAHYLGITLKDNADHVLLKEAAKALGHLARSGGTLAGDVVEFEVKRALEWLEGNRSEQRRLAAVLVLKELAENTPTLFNVYVDQFLDRIWVPIRDPKLQIRMEAIGALRCCLALIAKRASGTERYYKIFTEAQQSFKHNNSDGIHGSLLTIGELLQNTGEFMLARFKEVCDTVFRYKDHRDKLVRETVIALLPKLAAFEPEAFVRGYLNLCLTHIINTLKNSGISRSIAFIALGEMAMAVRAHIVPQLDVIVALVKDGLTPRNRRPFSPQALTCVSMLARAVGPKLLPHMKDLVDQMFSAGLSSTLVDALTELSTHIPQLLNNIQDRLLTSISIILDHPHPTTAALRQGPLKRTASTGTVTQRPSSASLVADKAGDAYGNALTSLALATLGNFNFKHHNLLQFLRDCVLSYLDNDKANIRKEAATTCSKLLLRAGQSRTPDSAKHLVAGEEEIYEQAKLGPPQEVALICEILERLLVVSVADTDSSIRQTVLESLHPHFDPFLAEAENLHSLFVALNDEVFAIREATIKIIGRLAVRNPAYIMPSLRKTLVELITELQYGSDTRNREESSKLLSTLIASSGRLIKPYVLPIFQVLLPKLRDSDPSVASCILETLGELAMIGGEDMVKHLDMLLPIIIETLQDKAAVGTREVALRTLGRLIQSTGVVIEPYLTYEDLLPTLLHALKAGQSWGTRREGLKVLGVIGALDPFAFKQSQRRKLQRTRGGGASNEPPVKGAKDKDKTKGKQVEVAANAQANPASTSELPGLSQSSDEYFPTVAINALMRILREPGLSQHHNKVIQAVMFICKTLGPKCVPFLPRIIPPFLQVLKTDQDTIRDQIFTQLTILVSIAKGSIREYLDQMFELIRHHWHDTKCLSGHILTLVEAVSLAVRDDFKIYLPDLLPQLLGVLNSDRTPKREATLRVLQSLESFGATLADYLHLVVPALVRLAEQMGNPLSVCREAIQTLGNLCRSLNLADYASRILHPLARILNTTDRSVATPAHSIVLRVREAIMETLCVLVYQLGQGFAIFIPLMATVMQRQGIVHPHYSQLVSKIMKAQPLSRQDLLPARSQSVRKDSFDDDDAKRASTVGPHSPQSKLKVSQRNLKKVWEGASQRSTKEDWQEWMRGFSIELLKQSPSPALRACSTLAQKYHLLASELFNAAFVSCWTELHDKYQDDLVRSLETAFKSPSIPPEILQTLLNLAEFMEHDDKRLPIDTRTLGDLASKCHAYAKALHYKELEFDTSPSGTIQDLISINNQLQQPDAAVGILTYAKQHHKLELKESWYEKLQRWEDALEAYERKQLMAQLNPKDETRGAFFLGRLRCLRALGEWDRCLSLSQHLWARAGENLNGGVLKREEIAPVAAAAAWNLGRWTDMEEFIGAIDKSSTEGDFFRAVLAVHRGQFREASVFIDRTRELLDTELTALVGESYNRAYRVVVKVQQMAELEEVVAYKTEADDEKRAFIRKMWSERLKGCQRDVDVWQQTLSVRSLVVAPHEDIPTWLKFSSLCRKSGRLAMSLKILTSLLGYDPRANQTSAHSRSGASSPLLPTHLPRVSFAYLKHIWAVGFTNEAYQRLSLFTSALEPSVLTPLLALSPPALPFSNAPSGFYGDRGPRQSTGSLNKTPFILDDEHTHLPALHPILRPQTSNTSTTSTVSHSPVPLSPRMACVSPSFQPLRSPLPGTGHLAPLLAKCYLKLGDWQLVIHDRLDEQVIPQVISSYQSATQCDPSSYKVWHAWAVMNFRVVTHYKQRRSAIAKPKQTAEEDGEPREGAKTLTAAEEGEIARLDAMAAKHVVPAIQGFFKSIALAGEQGLQDILRLLTLWFAHGKVREVEAALKRGFGAISIDTWLAVIPQIVARIHTSQKTLRRMIHELLCDIGSVHPQALVYPLTVAEQSQSPARKAGALVVMSHIKRHSPVLVDQAGTVSRELIRVAILWQEMWHEALEEASRLWFGQHNVEGMFQTLEPLHEIMAKGPQTLREVAFMHGYGRDLREGWEWCKKYKHSGKESDLNQAWDLYCTVFRKMTKQLNLITHLELRYVSPRLLTAHDLQLAVPGTYLDSQHRHVPGSLVRIKSFVPSSRVIESKQRPRKVAIVGSDGKEYAFLLKGHGDLRQDKRVMQLFGLVNTLLANDRDTSKKDLQIRGYSVIPLAPNSGLIQWLGHCDTLHALIKDYRDARQVLLSVEQRQMVSMAPDHLLLALIQKVEVLEHALSRTTGQDLAQVLWLKSQNAEVWLDRRTNYTRSLAVMSMVGYILGLGDRHPCNLMLDRFSGKIIHIDFGDCFEVAMHREKFPERIPFRLTRMLVKAMEVSGLEGNFRSTCESVMRVLRGNRESVMAVLEAFVYDPLINWRLLTTTKRMHEEDGGEEYETLHDPEDSELLSVAASMNQSTHSSPTSEIDLLEASGQVEEKSEQLNQKALTVIRRVESKLTGKDFGEHVLDVPAQVEELLAEATSHVNLCQCYVGWCPFW